MGAIIAYKKTGGGAFAFDEAERKAGMEMLGAALRTIAAGEDRRDALFDRLEAFFGDSNQTLRWEYNDGTSTIHLEVEEIETRGVDDIVLTLKKVTGTDHELVVRVQRDDRAEERRNGMAAPRKRVFRMATVFPDDTDWDGLVYLEDVAEEIGVPTADITDAANYLAVFKLLGRCH